VRTRDIEGSQDRLHESRVTRKNRVVNFAASLPFARCTQGRRLRAGLRDANENGWPMRFSTLTVTVVTALLGTCLGALGACDASGKKPESSIAPAAPGELRVIADEHGFTPSSLPIAKGAPGSLATVTFVRTSDQTCATEVVFPDLDVKKTLPLNELVAVSVPSDAARTLSFQCGMGMYKGALLVK
jgi:plastocyanin domain-containing protein